MTKEKKKEKEIAKGIEECSNRVQTLRSCEDDFEFEGLPLSLSFSKDNPPKKGRRFVRSGPLKLELRILCGRLDCHAHACSRRSRVGQADGQTDEGIPLSP